jgi:hypothetical protein
MSQTAEIIEQSRLAIHRARARQEELLADLRAHRAAFERRIEGRAFRRARDFEPINPLDEWLEVGNRPGSALDVPVLADAGRIEVITLNGTHYAREARS